MHIVDTWKIPILDKHLIPQHTSFLYGELRKFAEVLSETVKVVYKNGKTFCNSKCRFQVSYQASQGVSRLKDG